MRLRFFGRLRDTIGEREIDVVLPPEIVNSDQLRAWLGHRHPAVLDKSVRIALDDRIVAGVETVRNADEAAFLPPVSGG